MYLASNWLWLPTWVQFWYSLESNLSGQLIFHLVVKCTHDMSLFLLVEPVLCSCTVGHITACHSRPDTDNHLHTYFSSHRRLGPKSDRMENNSHPCAQRTLHPLCVVFHACMVGIPGIWILIYSWYCGIWISSGDGICSRGWDAEDVNLTSSRHRWLKCVNSHQALRWTQQCRDSRKLWERWGQSVSKTRPEDMRVGKPEPYVPGKDFDDWDFTFNGYAGTLDPAYPALLKAARQSPTVVMATPPHEQQSATLLYLLTMFTQKGALKVVRKAGNNGFEAYRQLCLMYGTSDQEGSTGQFVQIMTYKFGSKIEDVEDRLNEFLELVRRYDQANGTDPVPDQVRKACFISNTPEPLKTHLQLNVGKLGNFNALRMATEDYLRSRRIFKTTSAGNTHDEDSMEVDAVSRKGKGKEKSGKGRKGVVRKGKKSTQPKVTEKW